MKEKEYYSEISNIIETIEINSKVRILQDNSEKLQAYWNIGKLIVEAQGGLSRAKYGDNLIKKWSIKLTKLYGNNYSMRNLRNYRNFYELYQNVNAVRSQLTWTHYRYLLPIKNENERNYYINLAILNNLSSRELINEIKNKSFDRLSYADKENIKLIDSNNYSLTIKDMIKDPILIKTNKSIDNINEKALHKYIIEMLEKKFLELGTGFTLAGHEYKINVGNKIYRIDLLFFNVELNSYVVMEVKTRELQPKDIGQIEFYVKYIDEHLKKVYHKNTVGLLIVKKKNKYVIEYCTNKDILITDYEIIN